MIAALVATLHPYVVWHDVHVNREILDGLLLAAITLLALLAYERRSLAARARAPGAVAGLAILGNSRLLLLPLVLAPYVVWRVRPGRRAVAVGAPRRASRAARRVAPWASATRSQVGCFAITTDARALWKANNPRDLRRPRRAAAWIDDVPELPGVPPWPEQAAEISGAPRANGGRRVRPDARSTSDEVIDFWREQPGEKARLAVQAVGMLWSPFLRSTADDAGPAGPRRPRAAHGRAGVRRSLLYALAVWGAFLARGGSSRSRRCCSRYNTADGDGVRGDGALPRARGTSCSPCSRRSRSSGSGRSCARRRALTPPRAPPRRAPRSARCSAPGRTPRARAAARLRPSRRRVRGRRRARRIAAASASGSPGGTSSPVSPSATISGQAADGARDHRPAALHRLERDHPEALAERRHDDDRGALQHGLGGGDAAEQADRVVRARARATVAWSSCSSGPSPAISSSRPGSRSRAATAREEDVVALDRDQPPDDREPRSAGVGGGGSGPGSMP